MEEIKRESVELAFNTNRSDGYPGEVRLAFT